MDNSSDPQQQNPVPVNENKQQPESNKVTLDDLYGSSTQPQEDLPLRKDRLQPPGFQENRNIPPEIPQDQNIPQENQGNSKTSALPIIRLIIGLIGVILIIVLLFLFVTFISSMFNSSSHKIKLTFWGLWEDANTMQAAISSFERQNPNIVIQYEKEDLKQYSQRLIERIQQNTGPDIFTYHSSWLPMVKPLLVPLPTSVITKKELQNNFYPVVSTDLVKNGALFGIPLEIDTLSLYVNNSIIKNAKASIPNTWDNFATTARSLTQKDQNGKIKIAGAAMGTYDNITHAPDILSALFIQNGVDIGSLSPKSNVSDALNFYTSFATGDSKVWDNTLDPSQLAFSKGNLAMYFGYSWDTFMLKAANPSLDFSIYPIPHLPGRNTSAASYWVEGVSVKSIHQKEALLFMKFLAQKNTQALLFTEESKTRLFGEPYSRSDLGETLKSNPLVYPFVSQGINAQSSFFAGETQDTGINAQMNGYLGNAVRSILNNTSSDTASDTLIKGVAQVENQYASQ